MRITVLAGGIGAARFLRGLLAAAPNATITVIGNTADDITLFGLRVCPDLDSVMYTLGGGSDEEQGWGRAGETHRIGDELAAYGAGPAWFTLGDLDFATHILRSQLLAEGKPLSEVTRVLCERWRPGVRLLPMSDDRVETRVKVKDELIHFQEWWVRLHAAVPAREIVFDGAAQAAPAPGVIEAIAAADAVLLPPSNPVVSIGTILAVPGIRAALREAKARVVGVSPIVRDRPVRGMADACLTAIGVPTTAEAVGRLLGSRKDSTDGILDGWLVHTGDAADVPGVDVRSVPLMMTSTDATAEMVRAAFDLGGVTI